MTTGSNNQRPMFDSVLRAIAEQEARMSRPPAPLTRHRIERVVRAYVAQLVERARRGESVRVPGLGVFKAVTRKPRRVLHEGRWYEVPSKHVVVMRPSAAATARRGAP